VSEQAGVGIGAYDVGLRADGDAVLPDAVVRAELVTALEGARRKVVKQQAFLDAAVAEEERLTSAIAELDARGAQGEVTSDGVVGE